MGLVKYMKKKVEIMQKATPDFDMSILFNEKDEKELNRWRKSEKGEIVNLILSRISRGRVLVSDDEFCPWCVRYDLKCLKCEFRVRHGNCCRDDSSDYKIVREYLDDNLEGFSGFQSLLMPSKEELIQALSEDD